MSVENEPEPQAESGTRRPGFHMPKVNVAETRQKAEFILSRTWGLVRDPRAEWEQIRDEETNIPSILFGYVLPLAAIPPLCGAIGSLAFGEHYGDAVVRTPVATILVSAIVTLFASVALVYLLGILINTVAENFDAEKNEIASQKIAAYAMTPAFMSGVFSLWPPLWWVSLIGIGMTAFLIYRGLPILMKAEPERALGYTTTVMIAGLIAFIVLFALAGCVTQVGRL
jgi:hypothetical protein